MVKMLARHFYLLIALALLNIAAALAESNEASILTGTVRDQKGGPIPLATVLAKNDKSGLELGTVTNKSGTWEISSVPVGNYTVSITAQAFIKREFIEITVDAGVKTTVDATLKVGFNDSVTVTASKYEEEVLNAPAIVSIINEHEIQTLPTQNLPELLRIIPGVNVTQTSVNVTGVTSRSASAALPITQLGLVDGRTIYNDAIGYTSWDAVQVGYDDVKQIEVIRGPASAVWGSYAMNGVVNVITKTPREMIGTTLTLGIGTFDRTGGAAETDTGALYYARAAHAHALNDLWSYKITGGAYTQDAFARPQGTLPNDFHTPYPEYTNKGTTQPKVDFKVDYDCPDKKQNVNFAGGYASSSGIYPGAAGGADINANQSYWKINYNHGALGITGYLNSISFDGNYLLVTDANGQAGRWDGKSLAYHLEFGDSNTAGSKQLISYGGSLRHTQFKDLSFAPEAPNRTEGSAYLQDEILISNHFKWIVGVRIDKFNSLKGAVVSPRTMFMIKPVKTQAFRFSYNRAYLAPSVYWTHTNSYIMTRFDLGSIDPDLSGNFFNFPFCFCGNGDLEKQSLDAYEIGYTVFMVKNRINVGAAFYINDSEGDFYWPQTESYTSQNPPPGWPLPLEVLDALIAANAFGPGLGLPSVYKTANRGEVRNKGIELSTEIRFNRNITGYTNYSWQARPESEEFDVFSINLPPNHRFNAAADYNYSRYFGNVSFIYADKAYWNDILSALFSGSTKAYKVINITGGVRWGEGWKYTAMLRISNLANRLVQNHVYGDILRRQITGEFRMRF